MEYREDGRVPARVFADCALARATVAMTMASLRWSGRCRHFFSRKLTAVNHSLCRYIARPALANERVQCNAAGQVVLKLKTP